MLKNIKKLKNSMDKFLNEYKIKDIGIKTAEDREGE